MGILYGIRQVRLMNFKLDNFFFFFLEERIVQRDKCTFSLDLDTRKV